MENDEFTEIDIWCPWVDLGLKAFVDDCEGIDAWCSDLLVNVMVVDM